MIELPNECLFEIFTYLENNDMFSCLLVCRKWCRIAVLILWRKLNTFKSKKLIKVCLSSLNTEEQKLLLPFKIMLPNGPKPLFKYTTFIEIIYFDTENGILDWLDCEGNYPPYIKKEKWSINVAHTIGSSLIAMFLRTSIKIKELHICDIICSQMINLVENFCKSTTLNYLGFANNKIVFEERRKLAEILCSNTTLTSLYIGNNQLGFEGGMVLAEALYKNTTLTRLHLWNNQLGPEVGKALANALCKNITLIYLNIGNNQLGLEGAIALAEALCKNATLTQLYLYKNQFGSAGGEKLAEALYKNTALTHLNVGNNKLNYVGGKAFAKVLYKNTTLISLDFRENFDSMFHYEAGCAFVEALCENKTLTDLKLYGNNLCDPHLKIINDFLENNRKRITGQ